MSFAGSKTFDDLMLSLAKDIGNSKNTILFYHKGYLITENTFQFEELCSFDSLKNGIQAWKNSIYNVIL